jgi:hypothetical protein
VRRKGISATTVSNHSNHAILVAAEEVEDREVDMAA